MPVLKFPGVEKTIHDLTPQELEKQVERVFGDLPPLTEEALAKQHEQVWEDYYDEMAREAITDFSILLSDYKEATIGKSGEDSAEASAVAAQLAPIRTKLRQFRNNIDDPNVKQAVKSLRKIWAEYKGGYYDDKGALQWRSKPAGPEVVSAFWGTANFDL